MRLLPLFALFVAVSAHAQTRLELTDPQLWVDGQRVSVSGAPLFTGDFDGLEMEVPRLGTLTVSTRPFEGARRAGDFEGTRLVLVVDGRSLRLRSRAPLLGTAAPTPAYARLDANPLTPTSGPAHIRLPLAPPETPRVPAPPAPTPLNPDRQLEALRAERDGLQAERDRLRVELAQARQERDDARLRLDVLRDRVERLQLELVNGRPSADRLRQERDALRDEVARLRASLAALGTPAAAPPAADEPAAPVPPARVSLPSFELARLQNAEEIQRRIASTRYPEWAAASGLGGDVLVLFQADASGAVVRTAVPRPIGGGLDALAEEIVRAMRFTPVRTEGRATGLRSQVVVRFRP